MTWTVTDRGDVAAPTGDTDISIDAFTPAANSLLIVLSTSATDGDISGITGHGTWSLVDSAEWVTENVDMDIWACRVGGSPTEAGLTISRSYTFRHAVQAIEISSTNGINGTTVGDAFGTASAIAEQYQPSTLTASLDAFAQSSNLTLGFATMRFAYADGRYAPSSGYTELNEWATGGTQYSNATVYIDEADTTPSIEVTSISLDVAFRAIEVKEAAGGGSTAKGGRLTLLGVS